eukprot:scaffold11440_cov136-Isochrysis_galbana.AAC.5
MAGCPEGYMIHDTYIHTYKVVPEQRHVVTPSSNVATAECFDRKHVLLRRVDVFFDVLLDALEGARRDAVRAVARRCACRRT